MSKPGHNSGKGGPISADRLKSFIERIERLEEERKSIGGDIRDVYAEAKGVGYDVKTMRKIVQLRAMDAADRAEAETLLDTYCHALGMVYTSADFSEDALVEQASRIVSEVDRCMDLVTDGQPPGIYAIQGLIGCSTGKASKLRGLVADRISRSEAKVREMKAAIGPTQAYIDSFAVSQPEDGDDGITDAAPQGDSTPLAPQADEVAASAAMPDPRGGEGTGTHSESCGERAGTRSPNRSRVETAHCDGDARNQANPAVIGPPARFDSGPHDTTPFLGDDPGPPPEFLRRRG